jgi:selenide,water dikinase
VLVNTGARAGDALVLTKGLGTGVISTGIKRGQAQPEWIEAASASMTTLNRAASEIALRYDVHGMTDVTGFGLIGHARELALGSNVSLVLDSRQVPLLGGALECVRLGLIPGGLKANREFAECNVEYGADVAEELRTILFDPQTAGGLLISLAPAEADTLVNELRAATLDARRIGEVKPAGKPLIRVL